MASLYIIYIFILLILGGNLFSYLKRRKELKRSEQIIYLYMLISALGWVITNTIADLYKDVEIASTAARLAIIFPLNFMSAFLTIASIFPQTIIPRKSVSARILNWGALILTITFTIGINSEYNISSFKISPNGPAEYSPGIFYGVSLVYAIAILVATLAHWFRNFSNYTRTQKLQILTLITSLLTVYVFLGIGLTYFPAVGLLEYGPIAFISLGFLLYVINQTFFVKAFFSDIRESIVKILTIIVIGLIITISQYRFSQIQEYINPLGALLLSIVLFEIINFISKESKSVTQVGYERLRTKVLEFNSKTATTFKKELIIYELKKTLSLMFPSQSISFEFSNRGKNRIFKLCHRWWEIFGENRPITPELVIDESHKNQEYARWVAILLKNLVKENINIVLPIHTDKGVLGLVKLAGVNLSLNEKEYSIVELLTQNLSISMSRAYLYSEVISLNTHLEQKVKAQTKDINDKYQQLLEAQQRERDMIDIMGHELRTPISIIRLQFELLSDKLKTSEKRVYTEIKNYINNIDSAIFREVRLINSLLGATKIDQNKLELHFEKLKIVDLLRESYTAHIPDINKKGLKFSFKCPKNSERWVIVADKTRILEVFDNLINNAIKYTQQGDIHIELKRNDKFYVITFADTGVGISKDGLKHLGEKFYRADNENIDLVVKPGGTGLGIYVSIGIVKKHGGKFKVESELGKGSVFTIQLPIKLREKISKNQQSLNIFERLGLRK